MRKTVAVISLLTLLASLALAKDKKKKNEGQDATLNFVVVKANNGKPVRNAAVVLHALENGRQAKGGYELKTNLDGKTSFDGVPYGKLRVQVLAPGLQTFGQDYEIDEPVHNIIIKLNPPQKQYSVYDDNK
jgi:hypothetical protein